MNKGFKSFSYAILIGGLATMTACNKNDETVFQPYSVPGTYNFENVEYKEAASRISSSLGFGSYLSKATARQLNQDTINNLWNNINNSFTAETVVNLPFTVTELNTSTFSLPSKTADAASLKAYADSMVKMSQFYNTPVNASQGVAGKIGTRAVNYMGLEFNQLVAKGLFGALSLNNVIAHLNKVPTDDNNTVVAGTGTAMQHDWDLAFGYIGLPKNYDSSINYTQSPYNTNSARPLAIGGYFFERARPIGAGGRVFDAFLKGRAAIGVKDYATRDAAIKTIKEYLEKTLAIAGYTYLGLSKTRSDNAARFHDYSEGLGFMLALKYRATDSKLTEANYQTLVGLLKTDYWTLAADASFTKVNQAQAILTAAYGQLQ